MKRKQTLNITLITGVMFFIASCNGMFEDIYDAKTVIAADTYGFTNRNDANFSGTIYLNTTSFTKWMYVNFHTLSIDSADVADSTRIPDKWDIAIHHYDAKTNDGSSLEMSLTDINKANTTATFADSLFAKDIWTDNKVIIDMSRMMEGKISYAESYYNTVLSKWINVDISNMPPSYTLSGKVYIVRLEDGTYAALKLTNYMNDSGVKGYLTIDYIYPLHQ